VLAVVAMVFGRALIAPAPRPRPAPSKAKAFVRFRDTAGGISILRPAGWRRVVSPDPQVRLLAEGDGASMQVRMANLGIQVGPESLGPAKKLTDRLVRSAGGAKPLRPPRRVTLAGLPGYLYIYTFRDPATGAQGAHAHYFLFRGQSLLTIVFQVVPADGFARLAPLFDRLGETLRVSAG
jgi:hypothetical protein